MKTALDVAKLLAYVALIVLLGECAFAVHRLRPQAEATLTDVRRTVVIVAGAATNVEQGAREWKKASQAQAKASTDVLIESKQTLASIRGAVGNMDASLLTLSGQLGKGIEQQNQSLLETQTKLRESLAGLTDSTKELQRVLADSDKLISDPAIKVSIDNLAASSENATQVTQNLAKTTADVADGVHYEVQQLKAPVTKVKAVFNIALTVLRKLFF